MLPYFRRTLRAATERGGNMKYALVLLSALPLLGQSAAQRQAHTTIVILPQSPDGIGKPSGIFPAQMKTAYGFKQIPNYGKGQIIGIVDAYDDPNIESDLGVFDQQFGLPACTTANGCFQKVYANGTPPPKNGNWATEISLDVEWSHAIAPQAKILLVEGAGQSNAQLYQAVDVAVQNGASVISMSWGTNEYSGETSDDSHFNVSHVTFVAASGDSGHQSIYPAASPFVVAVGGTTLTINSSTGAWQSEAAWSGSGGGTSVYEPEPSYQASAQTSGQRGIPDVAYDADPKSGVPIYDTVGITGLLGWVKVGGTSMAAPQWAGLFAIANSIRAGFGKSALNQVQFSLYPAAEGDYHDITSGTNGSCGAQCTAGPGYDFVTGVGSPQANLLIRPLVTAP
jgi:subtilase family serine protease